MAENKVLTIGILAHVDAGKTSLTECLLHQAGATKALGSVDKGSAITDALAMEKSRGISIKASSVNFLWKGTTFQLVDTPGHLDFAAEVDRSLSILDGVILVVSAKEGVQAHTLNLWESLKERKLPVIIFFNKIDRDGVELEQVFSDFQKELDAKLFAINLPKITHEQVELIPMAEAKGFDSYILAQSIEYLAECDEAFMEAYLGGQTDDLQRIQHLATPYIKNQMLQTAIFGSAKLGIGKEALLQELEQKVPEARQSYEKISARVFKVEYHDKLGRLSYLKSYGATIKTKDSIYSQQLEREIKVNQIFKAEASGLEQVTELQTGEIGLVTTSEAIQAGDVLGTSKIADGFTPISHAVLGVEVKPLEDKDYQKLGEALEILHMEDPVLDFRWFKEEREFHIKILGPIQTEVLKDSLQERWGIAAEFLQPQVIYKETPTKAAEGYVRYWMPKPCWAIMTFLIEPAPAGSGVEFENTVRTSDVSNKYINEVKRAIPWTLKQGIHGYEVTDIKITLLAGEEHTVHSNPGDFLLATPMGVMRALENAGTDLLEPMYAFEIKAHQELLGAISGDLNQMHAQIESPLFEGEYFSMKGRVAVAEAMDYSIQFNATTSGKGRLKLTLDGYEKTSFSEEKTRAYKGVSPLNESQWILHMRGAFKADDRMMS